MKIVLRRTKSGMFAGNDPEVYMRVVFSHISHHIWIKDIKAQNEGHQELITLEYQAQPDTSDVDFNKEIRSAISLRGDLTLLSLELPAKTIQVEAMRVKENGSNGTTYELHNVFARYLASNPQIRAQCIKDNIVGMKFEFEEVSPTRYEYTGRVAVSSHRSPQPFQNAYHKFATILTNDEALRNNILDPSFRGIDLSIKPNGTSSIMLKQADLAEEKAPTRKLI